MAHGEVYRKSMTYTSRLVAITAGALYAAFALAGGPASAQTKASCKQDYAAKKAAGEADGQSEANFVKACRALPKSGSAAAAPASGGGATAQVDPGDSEADLAKKLANPVADLISVPFQNNLDYGGGPQRAGSQYILNVQPVIPFKLNDYWNLITRTIVPVTDVVHIIPGNPVGIGDTVLSFILFRRSRGTGSSWGPDRSSSTRRRRGTKSAPTNGRRTAFVALTQFGGYTFGILAIIFGVSEPARHEFSGAADSGETVRPSGAVGTHARISARIEFFAAYTFLPRPPSTCLRSRPTIGPRESGPCRSSAASARFSKSAASRSASPSSVSITSCGPTARLLGACGSCSRCCLRSSPRKRAIVTIPPRTVRPNWSASPIVA